MSKQATEKDGGKVCQICGKSDHLHRAILVRPALQSVIKSELKGFDANGWICEHDLNDLRHRYVEKIVKQEAGDLTKLEHEVLSSLEAQDIISKNPESEDAGPETFGRMLADKIASFGGSWTFILLFTAVILVWMTFNSIAAFRRPFDPYPFILLNLVLSCLAALQAPVILMSQKRQEQRDRQRGINDYQVNLKAELEIRHLHQKVDHLLTSQWNRLIEIQNIQMELMSEIRGRKKGE